MNFEQRIGAISPVSIVTPKSQAHGNSPMAPEPPYFCHSFAGRSLKISTCQKLEATAIGWRAISEGLLNGKVGDVSVRCARLRRRQPLKGGRGIAAARSEIEAQSLRRSTA